MTWEVIHREFEPEVCAGKDEDGNEVAPSYAPGNVVSDEAVPSGRLETPAYANWLAWLRRRGSGRNDEIASAADGNTLPSLHPVAETEGSEADAAQVGPCAVVGLPCRGYVRG